MPISKAPGPHPQPRTLTASMGHSAMSAKNSAEAEPARKMRFWYFLAASGPAMSEYVLPGGKESAPGRRQHGAWLLRPALRNALSAGALASNPIARMYKLLHCASRARLPGPAHPEQPSGSDLQPADSQLIPAPPRCHSLLEVLVQAELQERKQQNNRI